MSQQQIPPSVFTTTRTRAPIDHSKSAYAHLMTAPVRPDGNQDDPATASLASPQLPGARKRITSEMMMPAFKSIPAYKKIIDFIADLSLSCVGQDCRPTKPWYFTKTGEDNNGNNQIIVQRVDLASNAAKIEQDGASTTISTSSYSFASPITPVFIEFFSELHTWVSEIPLEKLMKSRFGNLAFRVFQTGLRQNAEKWISKIVRASGSSAAKDEKLVLSVIEEIIPYLYDSFGNAVRIDYGTGHELHFLLIIFILHKNKLLGDGDDDDANANSNNDKVLREMVLVVLDEYWRLMNRLQQHYRLEPAGSHGVWGLDDFHHLPFIFGAAQLSPAGSWKKENLNEPSSLSSSATIENAPLPSEIPSRPSCEEIAPRNFLFRAVLNTHRTKSGPFAEHSGVLQSISGLGSWPRLLTGMIKMYEGEVLGKFLIVQHLLFGKTFKWEVESSPNQQQQLQQHHHLHHHQHDHQHQHQPSH